MELKQLYDTLIAEGCNRFYIDGIGGPQNDDVELLSFDIFIAKEKITNIPYVDKDFEAVSKRLKYWQKCFFKGG